MMSVQFPMFKVHVPKEETLRNITDVINSGFINEGTQVNELTASLKSYLGVRNLVLTNSGTSALTLALKAAGVGAGDEVISISMTCVATNTPIINLGAKIVWADIDPETGSIDASDVKIKITAKTKAIVFVAWAGNPCDLSELRKISNEYGIPLIQDAAHAFDARWENESIANFADFTCFSFQAIKHFTTGDGGGIVCQNDESFKLVKKLKWFGYDRDSVKDERGEWKGQRWAADILQNEVGYKFNMNNISASIGLAQMKFIHSILRSHRENASRMSSNLSALKKVRLLKLPKQAISSNWVLTIRVDLKRENRDKLIEVMNIRGVGAGLVHVPNHVYSAFKDSLSPLIGTDAFSDTQISLPCGWWLTPADIDVICEIFDASLKEIE